MAYEYQIDELFGAHLDVAVLTLLGKPWRIEAFAIRYQHPERHMTARVVDAYGRVLNFDHDYRFHRDWTYAGYLLETGKISVMWPSPDAKGHMARPSAVQYGWTASHSYGRTMQEAITRAWLKQSTKTQSVELPQPLTFHTPFQQDLLDQLHGVKDVVKEY